jgi:hypothetical protein
VSTRIATATDDWGACHALLEEVLDRVEERAGFPNSLISDLIFMATTAEPSPLTKRWTGAPGTFATEVHRELDGAMRCSPGDARAERLAGIAAAIGCKARHQDRFLEMVEELAVATRALAAKRGGRLEADAADPIVALRDALLNFNVLIAKLELRELLRPDQYIYQNTRTNDDPTLMAFGEYLALADFARWDISDIPLAKCGSVAQGHPERFTWFREGA